MALPKFSIDIKDPLTLIVNGHTLAAKDDEGRITALSIPDVAEISLGKRLSLGKAKQVFKVNQILEKPATPFPSYELRIAVRTKASIYILPMFPGLKSAYFFDKFLMNCFIGTPEKENVIALLYRFSGIRSFIEFEQALKNLHNFVEYEDNDSTVLYVFNIPDRYVEDFACFKAGRYSKMSEAYKKRILEFHNMDKASSYGQILYKNPVRRKLVEDKIGLSLLDHEELQSSPDLFSEIYDPELYSL